MRIIWSLPVRGESLGSSRGDLLRAGNLIEALRSQNHKVIVVADAASVGVAGYRCLVRPLFPEWFALRARDIGRTIHGALHGRRVARIALANRAQLIVETQVAFAASGAVAASIAGLPLILDDCSPSFEEMTWGVGLPSLARYVLRRQSRAAARVAVSSQALKDLLSSEGVPPGKLKVVPNAVDAKKYSATTLRREQTRKKLGISESCVIGFVGSFQPWHQVELLVQSVAHLTAEHDVRLVLVGEGKAILLEAEKLGVGDRVLALGAVPPSQVPCLLSAFDIGVLPNSNSYGQPMKLLEYAAAGLPAVAPDLPPVREVLQDRVHGLLFSPDDGNGLTRALAELITNADLRKRLGSRARSDVAAKSSWVQSARRLIDGFEST